mmetsp:Transcript_5198/g.18682  ORF Transcript_5198/g.18682 Transcript_5198/m.18682 type:complete len:337 (+) Transcript_5198:3438-4448(+)
MSPRRQTASSWSWLPWAACSRCCSTTTRGQPDTRRCRRGGSSPGPATGSSPSSSGCAFAQRSCRIGMRGRQPARLSRSRHGVSTSAVPSPRCTRSFSSRSARSCCSAKTASRSCPWRSRQRCSLRPSERRARWRGPRCSTGSFVTPNSRPRRPEAGALLCRRGGAPARSSPDAARAAARRSGATSRTACARSSSGRWRPRRATIRAGTESASSGAGSSGSPAPHASSPFSSTFGTRRWTFQLAISSLRSWRRWALASRGRPARRCSIPCSPCITTPLSTSSTRWPSRRCQLASPASSSTSCAWSGAACAWRASCSSSACPCSLAPRSSSRCRRSRR